MKNYIYSTLTEDVEYALYNPQVDLTKGAAPVPAQRKVLIKGGANKATCAPDRLHTPRGICTVVSDTDLEFLLANEVFKLHQKNGFIKVEKKDMSMEKAVKDMAPKDASAPKTPNDYKNVAGPKPEELVRAA